MILFEEFPKMARWSRDVVITEKIDGTNGAVVVESLAQADATDALWWRDGYAIYAQSRSKIITPADDNFGFARWVQENAEDLAIGLGFGRHFGEWWGAGIQRRYGQTKKRFSLFNTSRWAEKRPACCDLVPVLYAGPNAPGVMEDCIARLAQNGSVAAPGFMDPEGVVMFHTAGSVGFKKTIKKDEVPKALAGVAP